MRKGLIAPRSAGHLQEQNGKEIFRDVTINDAPPAIRYSLTRRSFQDDVQRRTNSVVITKGRYVAPGTQAHGDELPLYLHIMPGRSLQVPNNFTCLQFTVRIVLISNGPSLLSASIS